MIICGHNGEEYAVALTSPLSQVRQWIYEFQGGLIYKGPDKVVSFVINGIQYDYELKRGYRWDGASIPKRFQWLIGRPTDAKFRVASLFHDLGYEKRQIRVVQDVLFYYLLSSEGVPWWKADLMYKAVRAGGHVYFASDTSRFWRWVKSKL